MISKNNKEYNDYLGTLNIEEINELNTDSKTLLGKNFVFGRANYSSENDWNQNRILIWNGTEWSGGVGIGNLSMDSVSNFTNVNYTLVIALNEVQLLTDFSSYSAKYKDERPECVQADLGSKDCPYLLSLGDSFYSDGTAK